MRIKTRVKLGIISSLVLTATIALLLFLGTRAVNEASRLEGIAVEVIKGVAEMKIVTHEYILHPEERSLMQWQSRYGSLTKLLTGGHFKNPDEKIAADQISMHLERFKTVFSALITGLRKGETPGNQESVAFRGLQDRLMDELLMKSRLAVSLSFQLQQKIEARLVTTQKRVTFLTLLLVLTLTATITGMSIWINSSVAGPIAKLEKGSQIIGSGNLDHKIGTTAKDEIGELSRTFDKMTHDLKETTTSIVELNKEIDERKRAEEALRESELKYRQVFETNKALKLMIDPEDGAIVEANEAACNFYGYSKREMMTMKITDINALPPEKTHLEMQKAINEERLYFRFAHRLASGEVRDVEVYSGPVNLGKKTILYSIIHDVTDRIDAENKIRENEARYRLLFNSGNDAIFVHQPDTDGKPGRFIEANEVACQMYGYTRDELLRLTPLDLVISEGESYAFEKIRNVLSGKQSVFENTHKRKTGEEIPVEISPHLFDLDGRPTILSRVRDITEHKRSEKERQNLLARLQQAEKMESIGTLAGGIAHDFNNILAVILGNAELASIDVPDSNSAAKSLKAIHQASLRAKDMVQQLLAFSRKSDDDEKSRLFNMITIVKESMKMLRSAIPTSIEFKQHISEDSCSIMGDATQINQIVMNLVTNAGHAMSEGGLLELTLENITLQEEKSCLIGYYPPASTSG